MLIFGVVDGQEFARRAARLETVKEANVCDEQSRAEEGAAHFLFRVEDFHPVGMQNFPARSNESLDIS